MPSSNPSSIFGSLTRRPFVFLRHGQTDTNEAGTIAGRLEAQLTELGRQSARSLRDQLTQWPKDAIFVSPQDRAQESARLALGHDDFVSHYALRERNWGDWEGQPASTIRNRFDIPPNGESFEAVCERFIAFFNALPKAIELPLFICHSGIHRAALAATGHDPAGPSVPNSRPILFAPDSSLPNGWSRTEWIGQKKA